MPSRSKVVSFAAVAVVGLIIPLFGDPRVTPVTHPLWARMLLRALKMDDAVKTSDRASTVFEALSGRSSRSFRADAYMRADGVSSSGEAPISRISAGEGVGEVAYAVAIVHGGDYVLRARVSGDPAHPVSAEIAPMSGAGTVHTFTLMPSPEAGWIVGGTAHLDPGSYTTSLLLPSGTSLEYVEVAPPCVNPVEPIGGWKATAITSAEDLAVTGLRALDMEDTLAPADTPIERSGADFETDGVTLPAGTGFEKTVLKADAKGKEAVLVVDLPEAGLYTLEGFVAPGEGQRWRADSCRKAVLCASSPSGWRTVMSQSFSAGRHAFAVTLTDGAVVERVRLTRRKEAPADYVAAIRRAGFDPGSGQVSPAVAIAAMEFMSKLHADGQGRFCGDVPEPRTAAPDTAPNTTVAAASISPAGSAPPAAGPLSNALLPPQERASPVLPGPS
jgi:hypothetical protein